MQSAHVWFVYGILDAFYLGGFLYPFCMFYLKSDTFKTLQLNDKTAAGKSWKIINDCQAYEGAWGGAVSQN